MPRTKQSRRLANVLDWPRDDPNLIASSTTGFQGWMCLSTLNLHTKGVCFSVSTFSFDEDSTTIHNSPYTLLHTQSTHLSNVTISLYVSPGLSSPPCRFDLVAEVRVAPSNVSQPCGLINEPCMFPCEHNRDTCEATLEVGLGLPNGQ